MLIRVDSRNLIVPNMSSSVEDMIAETKEESRDLGVERELYLSGDIQGREATLYQALTGITRYQKNLIISPLEELGPDQIENIAEIAEHITRIPHSRMLNFLEGRRLKNWFRDLPVKLLLETNNGYEEIIADQIPSINPQSVYHPEGISKTSTTADYDNRFFDRLKNEGVIGYFHTHPQVDENLMLSVSDINQMALLKEGINQKKIVAGVGNSSHGEKFYLF